MKFEFSGKFAGVGAVIACAAVIAPPASAETLPVAGIYSARSDDAAAVNSIAVENFSGDKGASLSFAITDALEGAVLYGEPYFDLLPVNDGSVDAVLRGSANAEAVEIELDDRQVVKCKKKDADKKCIREKVTFYECARLEVSLYPHIRLIGADGREIYRKRDTLTASDEFCTDDSSIPSFESMLEGLVNSFASRVRYDLAPVYRDQQIRVLESRKGMKGDPRKAFKDALRLTKTDIGGACREFEAIEAVYPEHMSVLFNIGLCAEGQDQLDKAETYYEQVLALDPRKDYPRQGLDRISDRRRADAQLEVHYGSIGDPIGDAAETAAEAAVE